MSYYREMVQDMDASQKLELMTVIIDSMKPVTKIEQNEALPPYSMAEIDAMLDEAEAAFNAGDYLTQDEVFHHNETIGL